LLADKTWVAEGDTTSQWRKWIVARSWIGFAGLSKYDAMLFGAGLFIFIVGSPKQRCMLTHPAPWVGAIIALAICTPVLVWNAQHHWASFAFQGGRALGQSFPKLGQFFVNLGGQIIWMFPWVFVPMITATYLKLRKGRAAERRSNTSSAQASIFALNNYGPLRRARTREQGGSDDVLTRRCYLE
jgi:4-amino-4-deoxy-L-arabinose transferase-like glycosyltransferase